MGGVLLAHNLASIAVIWVDLISIIVVYKIGVLFVGIVLANRRKGWKRRAV